MIPKINYLVSMNSNFINFKDANQYLIWIFIVGCALGIANYALGVWPSLEQSLIQQIIISFVIGYSLVLISINAPQWFANKMGETKTKVILLLLFCLTGIVGSEVEILVRKFVFQDETYQFLSGGGLYLFNSILTSILGFMTYAWISLKRNQTQTIIAPESNPIEDILPDKLTTTIPIKQGEAVTLRALEEVIFFEAYDNYSFLYDLDSNKFLCNYSLIFLEKKLASNFIRVHRKHLINKDHIYQIKPHLKGRFVIQFKDKKQTTITSSNSYTESIKALIRL